MMKFPKIDMPENAQNDDPLPLAALDRITPRDFFAAIAMQALIQSPVLTSGESFAYEVIPAESFRIADEMMFIRKMRPKK